jgi:hypothetical protein
MEDEYWPRVMSNGELGINRVESLGSTIRELVCFFVGVIQFILTLSVLLRTFCVPTIKTEVQIYNLKGTVR